MAVVGARIFVDGHHGTVKFIGKVPPTEGEWLGVEWDDPKRGKHDGTKDSVRYFNTSHPTSGSFIRPKKADFGQDVMSAVKERYGALEDENAGVIVEDMFVCGKNQRTTVEVVGAKSVNLHQSQFNQLKEVALRGMPVSTAGRLGDIHSAIPNVKDLDISDTLLPSWLEIAKITKQLPSLEILNVSDNLLEFKDGLDTTKEGFLKLRVLTANRCRIDWNDLVNLSDIMPSLQTIHACFNNITDLSISEDKFKNLKFLNLEGNNIEDWDYILRLSPLKSLETLILNNTGLKKIEFPDVCHGQTSHHLPKLRALSVFHNKISDWQSVNELNKLASFEDFKLRFNPLTEDSKHNEETKRALMIAKVGNLKVFNRTVVTEEERHGAELDYLRMFGKDWRKAGGHQDPSQNKPNDVFTLNHPRYQTCIDAHGACEDTELVVKSTALKNNLLDVTIDCPLQPEKPPIRKKLPAAMTVQKLKAMVQRWYRGNPTTLTLTYTNSKYPDREWEMDNDMRDIGYFAVQNGDCIHVKW